MNKLLITISSKNPTNLLIQNITNLNNFFNDYEKKITIIDSDSTDFTIYDQIKNLFPTIDIHFIKNKNYEFGAYKFSYLQYPDYDIYCCIQDNFIITQNIDISQINDNTSFIYYNNTGFEQFGPDWKYINILINKFFYNFDKDFINTYKHIDFTKFTLVTHNSFIVTESNIKNIFNTFTLPPTEKIHSCLYERLFGLYFIINNFKTIDISYCVKKYNGNRI